MARNKLPVVSALSILDGYVYAFPDDGVDNSGKPKMYRTQMEAAFKKKIKGVGHVFRAGKRAVDADGNVSFAAVEPPADVELAKLDSDALDFLHKSLARRIDVHKEAEVKQAAELEGHLKRAAAIARNQAQGASGARPAAPAAKVKE